MPWWVAGIVSSAGLWRAPSIVLPFAAHHPAPDDLVHLFHGHRPLRWFYRGARAHESIDVLTAGMLPPAHAPA